MTSLDLKPFNSDERSTWKKLFENQALKRDEQLVDFFSEGIETLGMCADEIPDLKVINAILKRKTGFQGVPVEGLEGPQSFFKMLAQREFPIGNFIRDSKDLSYTPAPDVFHDLYGHIPFYADLDYAEACQRFGEAATPYFHDPDRLRQFERFFWFTFEFALIRTPKGLRIFGAGIASSFGECHYALGGEPQVLPFDTDRIRRQEFRIDQMQKRLFVLEDAKQLYASLDEFLDGVEKPDEGVISIFEG